MKNVDKIPTGSQNGEGAVKVSDGLLFDKVTVNDNFYFDDKICISITVHMRSLLLQPEILQFLFHGKTRKEL